jgi:cardiolipin synthase
MLDPIADKLLVGAALMMLVGQQHLSAFGLYPAVIIMLREILVSGLREYLAEIRIGLPVTKLAKWKTGFQMGAIGTLIAGEPTATLLHLSFLPVNAIGEAMLWAAAALTLVTGWDYLTASLHHAAGPPQAPAVPERQAPSS